MNVLLPTPGTPVMPIAPGTAGGWQQFQQHLLRLLPVLRMAALDQRDRTRKHGPIAVPHAGDEIVGRKLAASVGLGHVVAAVARWKWRLRVRRHGGVGVRGK